MFKNVNSQHLLIGILIVFIVFIFLSREDFGWPSPPKIPTAPNIYIPKDVDLKSIPANKTCPPNSSLINDICEYSTSIRRRTIGGFPGGIPLDCPDNYEPFGRTRCQVIKRTTQPTLICNDGYILQKDGTCLEECTSGNQTGLVCTVCDKGTLQGRMCFSCNGNKTLKYGMCYDE